MKRTWTTLILTLAALVAVGLFTALVFAEDAPEAAPAAKAPAYVGSKACKTCHMGEKKGSMWEIWLESAHSKSMAVLNVEKGEDKDPKCLKCHTTGFGAGGYGTEGLDAALATPEGLGAVGCESCHGPGSEYKAMKIMKDRDAAVAAGMLLPDEATCTKCHNEESPTFKGFNFEEMMAKIAHKLPATTE